MLSRRVARFCQACHLSGTVGTGETRQDVSLSSPKSRSGLLLMTARVSAAGQDQPEVFEENVPMTTRSTRTATYRFTRNGTSTAGFMSSQRASTDAMTVVRSWEIRGAGRSIEVVEDEDDYLVVRMTFEDADLDSAAADLESLCIEKGIEREPVV